MSTGAGTRGGRGSPPTLLGLCGRLGDPSGVARLLPSHTLRGPRHRGSARPAGRGQALRETATSLMGMASDLVVALVAGGFGLGGGLAGVALTAWTSRKADERRLAEEDARRWLTDRRRIYADYLGLAETLLKEVDATAVFLSYDGKHSVSEGDEQFLSEGEFDFHRRWDEDLQPALAEVQLMAGPQVADVARRVSGAFLELVHFIESRAAFSDYYPAWFQTQDLIHVLRNAMRTELGLPPFGSEEISHEEQDWPWLPDRPPRESYVQSHRRTE